MAGMKKTPIKVAILLPNLNVGGAERLVLEELLCLKGDERFSFEVHLVFEKGAQAEKVTELGIPLHVWNAPHRSPRMLKACWEISRHLKRTGCDILHFHLFDHVAPYIGKLAGVKVVGTVHNNIAFGLGVRTGLRNCDLVIGCGKQVVDNVGGFVRADRLRVLSNAIAHKRGAPAGRAALCKRLAIPEDAAIILSLGRLTRQKGYDVLMAAFQLLLHRFPNSVLLIGGAGELKDDLLAASMAGNLSGQVRLLGLIDNVDDVLSACDVYVNSSRWEGLPLTLIEAMAHAKPLVATDVGGNAEVVRDGVSGILVPTEDPVALSQALARLLSDRNLIGSLGTGAYDLFRSSYSINEHCTTLCNYYLTLMSASSPA